MAYKASWASSVKDLSWSIRLGSSAFRGPLRGPGHAGGRRTGGESVVQVTELTVQRGRVRMLALEPPARVGVVGIEQGDDRILLVVVGVGVADDQR